jgi:hypothetical protein
MTAPKKGNFERGIIHNKRTNSANIAAKVAGALGANIQSGVAICGCLFDVTGAGRGAICWP